MSIHFLLSAASRGFGLLHIMQMSDADIFALFCRARWPSTQGAAICPDCNMPATGPDARKRFKCKWCVRHFSLTSGTALHGRKLSLRQLLLVVTLWATAAKGTSAAQLSRQLDVNHRTTFALFHKLRHSFMAECAGRRIGGEGEEVEFDGCYVGGHVRKANWRKNRRDRRKARNKSPKRRVVIVGRERKPTGRTIVTVSPTEAGGVPFLAQRMRPGTIGYGDEAPSWNDLHATHEIYRINHEEAYSDEVACTNQAESFFSRLRKLERGQHHRISGHHLERYAVEAAFREDHRRLSALELVMLILHLALSCGPDPEFRAYQRRPRKSRR